MGHRATVLGRSGDQGVDVILDHGGERVAVQCKNYKRRVGNKPVQEVYAGAKHHGCSQAWVVAPAGYTKGAFELARSVGVSLFDADAIQGWIKQVDQIEKNRERAA
jgi:HJR/Mrr/RecB family endonuclease